MKERQKDAWVGAASSGAVVLETQVVGFRALERGSWCCGFRV